jgi:multidrug resistance efflux pump
LTPLDEDLHEISARIRSPHAELTAAEIRASERAARELRPCLSLSPDRRGGTATAERCRQALAASAKLAAAEIAASEHAARELRSCRQKRGGGPSIEDCRQPLALFHRAVDRLRLFF